MRRACANPWLPLLSLAVAACRGPGDKIFELAGTAPASTGLIETEAGAINVNDEGQALAVDVQGRALWRAEVCHPVRQRGTVVGGTLWVACENAEWSGLDVRTGRLRWKQTARGAPHGPLTSTEVALPPQLPELKERWGAVGFIATADGGIEAIDETATSGWAGRRGAKLHAAREVLLAAAPGEGVVAFDAKNGARLWSDDKDAVAMASTAELAVLGRSSGDVVARRLSDGATLWSVTLGSLTPDAISVDQGLIRVGMVNGTLAQLSPEDGAESERVQLQGELAAPVRHGVATLRGRDGCAVLLDRMKRICVDHQLRGSAVVQDGVLLLGPRDGRVLGFRLTASAP